MTWDQQIAAHLSFGLMLTTLAGLFIRGRARLSTAFTAYVLLAVTTNRLITWWPERFFTAEFWWAKETAYAALIALVAVEISALAFAGLPRARALCGTLQAFLIWMTLAALVSGVKSDSYAVLLGVAQPRGRAGSVWLFVAIAAAAAYFRVPLYSFHRSIVVGFVLYLAVYSWGLSLVGAFGWAAYPYYAALDQSAYVATATVWAIAAWKPAEVTGLSPEAQARLWPWA